MPLAAPARHLIDVQSFVETMAIRQEALESQWKTPPPAVPLRMDRPSASMDSQRMHRFILEYSTRQSFLLDSRESIKNPSRIFKESSKNSLHLKPVPAIPLDP